MTTDIAVYPVLYQLATMIEELADAIKFKEDGDDGLASLSLEAVKRKVNTLRWDIKNGRP